MNDSEFLKAEPTDIDALILGNQCLIMSVLAINAPSKYVKELFNAIATTAKFLKVDLNG